MLGEAYSDFLARKTQIDSDHGFEPEWIPDFLFSFQRSLVEWATRKGRAAVFADCGLGKTPMSLVWAENVRRRTGKPVLIVTPLAVSYQIAAEAEKFGVDASISRGGEITAGLVVTNYERLHLFDRERFGGIVCDESSAIKNFDGVRRALVTDFARRMPYRLLGTATAAPNDYIELGTSSEALGYLGHMDMLAQFFTNRDRNSNTKGRRYRNGDPQWRFKGHAEQSFWRWVTSWARACRRPSDLGFSDEGFVLPELDLRQHVVTARAPREDTLFDLPALGLREERAEQRRTIQERVTLAAEILADADRAVAWCQLNDESAALKQAISGAVEIRGSEPAEEKERKLLAFSQGDIRVLVTKPSIGAWGLNWQHCHRMTFFPSHSYEQYYQAVRRLWRFGQQQPVQVDLVTTEGGANVLRNLTRKAAQADRMFDHLVAYMQDALMIEREIAYARPVEVPAWIT